MVVHESKTKLLLIERMIKEKMNSGFCSSNGGALSTTRIQSQELWIVICKLRAPCATKKLNVPLVARSLRSTTPLIHIDTDRWRKMNMSD